MLKAGRFSISASSIPPTSIGRSSAQRARCHVNKDISRWGLVREYFLAQNEKEPGTTEAATGLALFGDAGLRTGPGSPPGANSSCRS